MHVHVLFHDRCFDGAAAAATFTRFYRERVDPAATFTYRGLTHKAGSSYDPSPFTEAEVHACVDFRYSASPRLTWWFDHHQSAFETPADEAHFKSAGNPRQFLDMNAKSCTKFIARVTQEKFGFDPSALGELIDWAEIIDGAQFPDAKTAVMLEAPAMKLMMIVEATADAAFGQRLIRDLADRSLSAVVADGYVQEKFAPLYKTHLETVEQVRQRAKLDGGVVTFDLSDLSVDNFNKFISYYLHPEAAYAVVVSAGPRRAKISVGSSPWPLTPRRHNIADICASYGGGGHAAVGAVSFPPEQIDHARKVAAEIAARLRS